MQDLNKWENKKETSIIGITTQGNFIKNAYGTERYPIERFYLSFVDQYGTSHIYSSKKMPQGDFFVLFNENKYKGIIRDQSGAALPVNNVFLVWCDQSTHGFRGICIPKINENKGLCFVWTLYGHPKGMETIVKKFLSAFIVDEDLRAIEEISE